VQECVDIATNFFSSLTSADSVCEMNESAPLVANFSSNKPILNNNTNITNNIGMRPVKVETISSFSIEKKPLIRDRIAIVSTDNNGSNIADSLTVKSISLSLNSSAKTNQPIVIPSLDDFYGILDSGTHLLPNANNNNNNNNNNNTDCFESHKKKRTTLGVEKKHDVEQIEERKVSDDPRTDELTRIDTKDFEESNRGQRSKRKRKSRPPIPQQQLQTTPRLIGSEQAIQNQILKERAEASHSIGVMANNGDGNCTFIATLIEENQSCKRVFLANLENELNEL
jgi:hypothetical protein